MCDVPLKQTCGNVKMPNCDCVIKYSIRNGVVYGASYFYRSMLGLGWLRAT